ncbi:MAG: hypothetical protein K2Q20_11400 [Phycisphaerales bacterium]|nr:hypothetical protein [Phycisphaerales bacterium]
MHVRVKRVTLTGDGLVVTGPDGEVRTILWEEVTSIRGLEVCRVRTSAGDTVRVPNEFHVKHVMWYHRRRLDGPTKPRSGRSMLIGLFLLFQIGGVIGAFVMPMAGMSAWRGYFSLAWGVTLMLILPGGLLWLMTRVSRSRSDAGSTRPILDPPRLDIPL